MLQPLPHCELIDILKSSRLIITDSGGIQEEAAFFKKPCIVCRNKTERQEGLEIFSWLCETPGRLIEMFANLKDHKIDKNIKCPYGDGMSADKILKILNNLVFNN